MSLTYIRWNRLRQRSVSCHRNFVQSNRTYFCFRFRFFQYNTISLVWIWATYSVLTRNKMSCSLDLRSESSLLSSRLRGSGCGSSRGIGRKSKEPDSDAILKRVKKDNARLLRELEEAEAGVKELADLKEQNERLKKEIEKMRGELVSKSDVDKVIRAIHDEKTAVAMIHLERDNVNSEILNMSKQKSSKSRRSG